MKREDYQQVQSLREAGYSYSRIANVLGVPKNSVKSYCNRFGIHLGAGDSISDADGLLRCRQCGGVILCEKHHAEKRFCSSECRMRWWNAHRNRAISKASQTTVCANCRRVFCSYIGEHRKYCSHRCYISDRFDKGDAHEKRAI